MSQPHPEARDTDEARRQRLERELLVARCQLGEPEAFDELVARWHPSLWRYVRAMTDDPVVAEEILQEGWLRILRGIGRLRDPGRLRAWLFSLVRRTFMDRLRVRYAESAVEPLDTEPEDRNVPDELAWSETERLDEALAHLSRSDRETIVLFYLRELDLQEAAQVLGIPVGTVKSRLHRARRLLRDRLDTKGALRCAPPDTTPPRPPDPRSRRSRSG